MVENVLTFGDLVRLKREQKGWLQKDLVKATGYTCVSLVERDEVTPSPKSKAMLIKALGITEKELAACKGSVKMPTTQATPVAELVRQLDDALDSVTELKLKGKLGQSITQQIKEDLTKARELVAGLDILDRLL
jgi:transcriptional regulator with XRE-family HTH domain